MKYNYHTHTSRCFHAKGTDEEYVLAAIEAGFDEIGFADHTPWKFDTQFISNMRMHENQLADYCKSIKSLREKYKDKISIKLGLECEYFSKYLPWLKGVIDEHEIDYIILGHHFATDENCGVYNGCLNTPDGIYRYRDDVVEAMESGLFSYVAHPDLFMRGYDKFDEHCQKVSQDILAKHIKKLNSQGSKITGGAVVVTKIDSGEVLASANYPTYSFDDYYNNYSSILSSPNNPLFDRAFKGTYPPGSVFKPLVAIAGLQENIIDRYSTIKCVEKYTYYQDYQPSCMHYHGTMNVISSISKSCNYFFFDCGRRVGITKLNNYSSIFGFGEITGVETSESAGVLAGPSYSSSIGSIWYDGQTLSAAIGQSDNSFTPLQLSTYTATIANGGTRYKTTLLNKVVSPSSKDVVFQNTPTVVAKSDVSANVIDIVKQGMLSVTSEGTASAYFADYPINIGGKTGTAQTTGRDNSVLIVFAPYEDPEIAISIVIEHGDRSISTGPIVKAILDEYFFTSEESYQDVMPNVPLK